MYRLCRITHRRSCRRFGRTVRIGATCQQDVRYPALIEYQRRVWAMDPKRSPYQVRFRYRWGETFHKNTLGTRWTHAVAMSGHAVTSDGRQHNVPDTPLLMLQPISLPAPSFIAYGLASFADSPACQLPPASLLPPPSLRHPMHARPAHKPLHVCSCRRKGIPWHVSGIGVEYRGKYTQRRRTVCGLLDGAGGMVGEEVIVTLAKRFVGGNSAT